MSKTTTVTNNDGTKFVVVRSATVTTDLSITRGVRKTARAGINVLTRVETRCDNRIERKESRQAELKSLREDKKNNDDRVDAIIDEKGGPVKSRRGASKKQEKETVSV